ncbi:MAG: 6-phosphofructokinase [Flavobacteriales bacterium]|nr:6-phosphofructokinase [Flavobacteriales bacterium]MCZ2442740.1 6-phosphofructokinase [Flavobacteriales bacterium]
MKDIRKIAVCTSGGDAPGMNAAIRSVVRTGMANGFEVWGIRRGYQGMIDNDMMRLTSSDVSNIIQRGGTILKTARSEAFYHAEGRQMAYQHLLSAGIDAVLVIGGDGSFAAANVFMHEHPDIAFVGIPGTIDNDLSGTDYTIGFDTALNTIVEAVDKLRDTAASHDRLFFVEVMGRDSGMIALYSGIAVGAESILIPETTTYVDKLIQLLKRGWQRHKSSCIIIVAEGDDAGGAAKIAEQVKHEFAHYDTRVSVLGHIQRGGNPTCQDRLLASRLGYEAVEALSRGKNGVMVGIQNEILKLTPFENAIKDKNKINMQLVKLAEILSI